MRVRAYSPPRRAQRLQCGGLAATKGKKLLAVEHEAHEDAVIVRVKGDVDSSTVDQLIDHLAGALKLAATHPAKLVAVDLQSVDFFGSAALNAVLDCHEGGNADGIAVRLVADHDQVLRPI